MAKIHTHYDNLKVARNAPPEVIRAAYKSLAQKYHPDRNLGSSDAVRVMKIINTAYDVLSDPTSRAEHDIWIAEQENLKYNQPKSNSPPQQQNNASNDNFVVATIGYVSIEKLPLDLKQKLINRLEDKVSSQIRVKLNTIFSNYFWILCCFGWLFFLIFTTNSTVWSSTESWWYFGISVFVIHLMANLAHSIYLYHTSPLRENLIITPIYFMITGNDRLKFFPLWTITDISATHNYRNGWFQSTDMKISFNQTPYEFTLWKKNDYERIIHFIQQSDSQVKAAINNNDVEFFKRHDDFFCVNHEEFVADTSPSKKTKNIAYLLCAALTLSIYMIAYVYNSGQVFIGSKSNSNTPVKQAANSLSTVSPSVYSKVPAHKQSSTEINYIRPLTAPNGSPWPAQAGYISGYDFLNNLGISTVTVDNSSNNADVYVKLYLLVGSKKFVCRHVFIPGFSKFKMESLAPGVYDVRYLDLNNGQIAKTEKFELRETQDYSGTQYSNITLTLYKVLNGNMQTINISADDF